MNNYSRTTCKDGLTKVSSNDHATCNAEKLSLTTSENINHASKDGTKHTKHSSTKAVITIEDKLKIQADNCTELLGSVTIQNCPGVRTSARVIQKMKQDQIRATTPPPSEREHKSKDERIAQKTPSQVRANKCIWSNIERNHLFDAINEFGKDFESISNYINAKLKRKCGTDVVFKTKDQVRQHYYQTFHKICKYIRFSDEVKKPAQEMYALINYGEMRRKLQFVSDKQFYKLKNLIYQGQVTVRVKGKNIRIKTPSCKTLRRLNQLDDSLEDIRLPSKIEVIVSPANMEAFGRVQTIAQNPRARITVPLQKKLVNFINLFEHKWRSTEMRLTEDASKLFPQPNSASQLTNNEQKNNNVENSTTELKPLPPPAHLIPEMCFLPKPGVTIHRPLLSITEYLSSVNICLSAYEERMGVKVRGEALCVDRPYNKRQRTESGSEKRSPDAKKLKCMTQIEKNDSSPSVTDLKPAFKEEPGSEAEHEALPIKTEINNSCRFGEELTEELNELLTDIEIKHDVTKIEQMVDVNVKEESINKACNGDLHSAETAKMSTAINSLTPLTCSLNQSNTTLTITTATNSTTAATTNITVTTGTTATAAVATSHIKTKRSTSSKTRSSATFKPLISEDVIRRIRKGWTVSNAADITIGDLYVVFGQDSKLELDYFWTDKTTTGEDTTNAATSIFAQKPNGIPYNPNECDDLQLRQNMDSATISNKLKHLLLIANLSDRIRKRQCSCGHICDKSARTRIERDLATKTFISNKTFLQNAVSNGVNSVFRQPIIPMRRPVFNMESLKQLSASTRPKMSRQVLVQRLLLPGGVNHHKILDHNRLHNIVEIKQESKEELSSHIENSATTSVATERSQVETVPCNSFTNLLQQDLEQPETGTMETTNDVLPQTEDIQATITQDLQTTTENSIEDQTSEVTQDLNDVAVRQDDITPPPVSAFDETSNGSIFNNITPMHLIRESTSNSRWLEENLNDFSLTSLLGHLDEINSSRDILDPSSNLSVISESSVDYMSKFQEITALMRGQDND